MVSAGKTYIIVNKNTGTVLDCNEGNGWVRAWRHRSGDNQKWVLDREGPGHRWTLRNVSTGRFLAYEYEGPGGAIRTADEPFHWHLAEDGEGYRIQVQDLNIDIENANPDDDAKIVLWHTTGDNQVWHFREA